MYHDLAMKTPLSGYEILVLLHSPNPDTYVLLCWKHVENSVFKCRASMSHISTSLFFPSCLNMSFTKMHPENYITDILSILFSSCFEHGTQMLDLLVTFLYFFLHQRKIVQKELTLACWIMREYDHKEMWSLWSYYITEQNPHTDKYTHRELLQMCVFDHFWWKDMGELWASSLLCFKT